METSSIQEQKSWYVAIVSNRSEKKCAALLELLGYECYVPVQKEKHIWKDGKERDIDRIMLSAMVLVHVTEQERKQIVKEPYIKRFMVNRAGQINNFGTHPVAIIPDSQIERLKFMLFNSKQSVSIEQIPLRKGDKVRVLRGNLRGLEGSVLRDQEGKSKLYIVLGILGIASVEIDPESIEKIQ